MQEEIENIKQDENDGIVLTDVDLQAKIKKLLKDMVTEASYGKLILNGFLPQFLALTVEVLSSYISAYFQAKFFGPTYYEVMLSYLAFINIMAKYVTYAIAQKHAVTVQLMDRNNQMDKMQEQVDNFVRIQIMYGVLCSILCTGISFAIKKPEYSAFNGYLLASSIVQPLGHALSSAYYMVFTLENRRFLVLALLTLRPVVSTAVEVFCYSFYDAGSGKLKTNWPTTCGTCLSLCLQAAWITGLNWGKTVLGATNLTNFKQNSQVFKPGLWITRGLWKQFLQYSEALFSAVTNLTMQIAVIVCSSYTRQVFTNAASRQEMMYQLFVFFYFGQIFRVAPTAMNTLYTNVAIHNVIDRNYKRVNSVSMMCVAISLVVDVVIGLLFYFVDIFQLFSHADFQKTDITTTLLYAAISGFGQVLTELAVSHAIIEHVSLYIIVLPIFKLIQVFLGASQLKNIIGDEADFILAIFFTELNSTTCSLVIFAIQYVTYVIKSKKMTKNKKDSKKKTLEEQLAAMQ